MILDFLEGRLFSSQFEAFKIALIGWLKAGPSKKLPYFSFDHVNSYMCLRLLLNKASGF